MDARPDGGGGHVAYTGQFGSVVFAEVQDGSRPAEVGWNGQSVGWQAKFMALFRAITGDPNLRLMNRQQFKQVEGRLFEFKRNDVKSRIFAFRRDRCWYLVHVFAGKKEDDLPEGEVKRATRCMEQAMARLEGIR